MENKSFLQTFHPVEKHLACTSLLKNNKHYIFPGLNVATQELIGDEISPETASEMYKPPLLNIGRPIPCLSPKHIVEQDNIKEDQVMQLVRNKYFWKRKKKQLQITVNRLTSRPVLYPELVKCVTKNQPVSKLPYGVVRMADHLANNPDKYFKGLYNWYYGNAMKRITVNNDQFLLYANGKNLNELCMTLIENPKNTDLIPVLTPQVSISMPESGLIYDIVTNECNGTIAVRQRDACSFLNYYEDDDGCISFKNYLTVKSSEFPFVAIDNCSTEFCTVNANRTIQFWSPDYLTHCVEYATLPANNEKLPDRFVQVKYNSDDSTQIFVIADRHNVYFYDKRENHANPCSHLKPYNQTEECEEISLLIQSVKEKTWYLGMSHSCLLLDTRMGFVERWTHMMSQPPSVGRVFAINQESDVLREAVILSTQTTNETVAIYHSEEKPRITCSPVRVPSRPDTLHEAQINGVLTNLSLQNKFNFSVIGFESYKMKKHMGVLSLISTGDVFHQSVSPNLGIFDKNATSLNEEELKYLENWESEFHVKNMNEKKSLTISRIVDFSELVNSIDESIEIPAWETRAPPKNAHWKLSIRNLHSYRDILAPYILNEYGVDDLEYSSDECEEDPVTENSEKVENWLSGDYSQSNDDSKDNEAKPGDFMFAISGLQEDDESVLDPVVELNVEVPPKHDLEALSQPRKKRRRRR